MLHILLKLNAFIVLEIIISKKFIFFAIMLGDFMGINLLFIRYTYFQFRKMNYIYNLHL